MHGVDRREDLVAARSLARGEALAHQSMAFGDQRRVPCSTVLLVEGDQFAACRDPSRAAGLGEEHQGEQPRYLSVLRQQGADQAREPDRLGRQLETDRIGLGAGRQVALIEDEVQDG